MRTQTPLKSLSSLENTHKFKFKQTSVPFTWKVILVEGTDTGFTLRQTETKFIVCHEETETEYPDRNETESALDEIIDVWVPNIQLVPTNRYRSFVPYWCGRTVKHAVPFFTMPVANVGGC